MALANSPIPAQFAGSGVVAWLQALQTGAIPAPRCSQASFGHVPGGKDCISSGGAGSAWGGTGALCHVQNQYYILTVQGILTLLLTSQASNARVVFSTVTHLAVATLTS